MRVTLSHMHASGRACSTDKYYVSGGIPTEEVEITKCRGKGFRYGILTQVVQPSPLRRVPFCPHAAECGGCPWQHISYPGQLQYKKEILQAALDKYAIPLPSQGIPDVTPSPLQQAYRNKTEYTFEADGLQMGFHPVDKPYDVVNCDICYLQPPIVHSTALQIKALALEHQIPFYRYATRSGLLRNLLMRHSSNGLCAVCGFTRHAEDIILPFMAALQKACPQVTSWYYSVWEGRPDQTFYDPQFFFVAGEAYLTEYIPIDPVASNASLRFCLSPQAFYQPNPQQAVNMYHYIASQMIDCKDQLIYDLYTGIGTIAGVLAAHQPHNHCVGIEGNARAIEDARRNAAQNGQNQIEFLTGDILQTFTPEFTARYPQPAVIVLDPPRSGTLTEIKKSMLAAAPQQIIYVSCNPVSLAWDLKQLCAGGYAVESIRPFDMFPQTHHVETVVSLQKES